jgi:hypothetical protein
MSSPHPGQTSRRCALPQGSGNGYRISFTIGKCEGFNCISRLGSVSHNVTVFYSTVRSSALLRCTS